jgi:uncharacterized protein (TIGR00661 family)
VKILYSASNNIGAKLQLARFLRAMYGTSHQFKISAYQISSPKVNIDWTLDALISILRPEQLSLRNDNLEIYFDQIKKYKPDLIISDLEYFTSYIAGVLNIPLWQCSSSLIQFGLTWQEKYALGVKKHFSFLIFRNFKDPMINIINNSDRNLIYSHYGDLDNPPKLEKQFEWIRPYHQTFKRHVPCQHYLTAGLVTSNKKVLNVIKGYPDSVAFLDTCSEKYPNLAIKNINMEDEYYCNLANSDFFVCQGQGSLLSDAFYNGKYSFIYPNYDDVEVIINSHLAQKYHSGRIVTHTEDLTNLPLLEVKPQYHKVKYLHELINEL